MPDQRTAPRRHGPFPSRPLQSAAAATTAALVLLVSMTVTTPASTAEIPAIAARQRVERKSFTDAEIIDAFFKTAFGAEYPLAGRVDRIRKYSAPVRVFAD